MDRKETNFSLSTFKLMIKLRSRLLRLATVARVMITRWNTSASLHVSIGPTQVLHLPAKKLGRPMVFNQTNEIGGQKCRCFNILKMSEPGGPEGFLIPTWIDSVHKRKKKVTCDDERVVHPVIIIINFLCIFCNSFRFDMSFLTKGIWLSLMKTQDFTLFGEQLNRSEIICSVKLL